MPRCSLTHEELDAILGTLRRRNEVLRPILVVRTVSSEDQQGHETKIVVAATRSLEKQRQPEVEGSVEAVLSESA